MRKHWIDNLRWVTVLLVLFYHVIYFYNNKGVFGGIGGFGDYPQHPQYQDAVMYILYPWFMPLLFLLAGISARYALEKHSGKEWFKARTRKLLVPGTIGLFVFHWMVGYFNTVVAERAGVFDGMPGAVKYAVMAISGTGPLWFIQVLWLLCPVLLLIRALDKKDRFWNRCGKANIVVIILLGVLFWAGEQTLVRNPRPDSLDGLLNLYKPLFYLVPFLLGYSAAHLRRRIRHHPGRHHLRAGRHLAAVPGQPAQLPVRLADVPGDDGLVQGPLRQDGPLRRLYDAQQLRHLYRPLPGRGKPRLYDEGPYPAAAAGHVCHFDSSRVHAVPPAVRTPAPHHLRPLGRAGRKIMGFCRNFPIFATQIKTG